MPLRVKVYLALLVPISLILWVADVIFPVYRKADDKSAIRA